MLRRLDGHAARNLRPRCVRLDREAAAEGLEPVRQVRQALLKARVFPWWTGAMLLASVGLTVADFLPLPKLPRILGSLDAELVFTAGGAMGLLLASSTQGSASRKQVRMASRALANLGLLSGLLLAWPASLN